MAIRLGPPQDAEALARVEERFFTPASAPKVTDTQLSIQASLRERITDVAMILEADVEPSPRQQQALQYLELVLMLGGKAIFERGHDA